MISRITEGLSDTQVRVIRVRMLFLAVKCLTDFLIGFSAGFTGALSKEGPFTAFSWAICFVAGLGFASKNLGDALSAALPPPAIASPPPTPGKVG